MKEREMNEFRKRLVLNICLLGCIVCMFLGIRQIVSDQRNDNNGFTAASWDVPKIPYYRGGSAYRTSSSQGSTVTLPSISSSSQRLFHHNAGISAGQGAGTCRNGYAQTGYSSSYPSAAGRPVRTFSNGAIHSYGGGGSGGGMTGGTSQQKASYNGGSVGYTTPSISISIPRTRSYAYKNVERSTTIPMRQAIQGRRRLPVYDEDEDYEYGDEVPDDKDPSLKWIYDEGRWITRDGMTKVENGKLYRWDETLGDWAFLGDQSDPGTPIGDVPWLLMLLVAGGYIVLRRGVAFRQIKTV